VHAPPATNGMLQLDILICPVSTTVHCHEWHAAAEHSDLSNKHNGALQEQPQNIPLLTGRGRCKLTLNISRYNCPQQQGHALGLGHIAQDCLQLSVGPLAIQYRLPHTCTCQTTIKRAVAIDKASTYTVKLSQNHAHNDKSTTDYQLHDFGTHVCGVVSKGLPGTTESQHVLCSPGCWHLQKPASRQAQPSGAVQGSGRSEAEQDMAHQQLSSAEPCQRQGSHHPS